MHDQAKEKAKINKPSFCASYRFHNRVRDRSRPLLARPGRVDLRELPSENATKDQSWIEFSSWEFVFRFFCSMFGVWGVKEQLSGDEFMRGALELNWKD